MRSRPLLCLLLILPATAARAEVTSSAAHALTVAHKLSTTAPAAAVYRAFGRVDRWWSSQHTFSGSAAHLSLRTEAGACFCERWKDGSVEHGRVVQAERDKLLRLSAALGPLLGLAVTGVLTFHLDPRPAAANQPAVTNLIVTYRVSGDPSHGLTSLAGPVDRVIGEQAARLVRFVETGKPE